MDHNLAVIVLAAGQGTRMKSSRPKVLHSIAGRSLIGHVLATAAELAPGYVVAVVRHERETVVATIADLLPTVLDLAVAGTAAPAGVEGGSWKNVLTSSAGTAKVSRPIDRMVWHMGVEVDHPQSAMRQGDFKILYYWDTKQVQLFDVAKDRAEAKDLSAEQPDRVAAMLAVLKEHVRAGLGEQPVAALERGEKPTDGGGKKVQRGDKQAPRESK